MLVTVDRETARHMGAAVSHTHQFVEQIALGRADTPKPH